MKILNQIIPETEGPDVGGLSRLLHLPHKILSHHEVNGLAQMVLHELGHSGELGLNKAGYLIDNPDFDCLRGIAGFCGDECKLHKQDVWENPESFEHDMKDAQFHKHLASFFHRSVPRKNVDELDDEAIAAVSSALGMQNPSFITWKMKHGNHGILLFEEKDAGAARHREFLHNYAALLSLC